MSDITPLIPCGYIERIWEITGGDYEWAEGSGPTSENPTVIFLEDADYTVTLTHSPPDNVLPDHCNIDGVTEFVIEAYDIPDVAINADDYFICEGEEITSNIIQFDDGNFDVYVIDWFVDGIYHSSDSSAINPILVPLIALENIQLKQ